MALFAHQNSRTTSPNGTLPLDLKGVTCFIDYENDEEEQTTRQITMHKLVRGSKGLLIQAYCHERKMPRAFRVDRIKGVVDEKTGEVTPFPGFFDKTYGFSLPGTTGVDPDIVQAKALRALMRPVISVLILAATEDGLLRPDELDEITRYAQREALLLHEAGKLETKPTANALSALGTLIGETHPRRTSLRGYLGHIRTYSPDRQERFENALSAVILVDGPATEKEREFLSEVDQIREEYEAEDAAFLEKENLLFDPAITASRKSTPAPMSAAAASGTRTMGVDIGSAAQNSIDADIRAALTGHSPQQHRGKRVKLVFWIITAVIAVLSALAGISDWRMFPLTFVALWIPFAALYWGLWLIARGVRWLQQKFS